MFFSKKSTLLKPRIYPYPTNHITSLRVLVVVDRCISPLGFSKELFGEEGQHLAAFEAKMQAIKGKKPEEVSFSKNKWFLLKKTLKELKRLVFFCWWMWKSYFCLGVFFGKIHEMLSYKKMFLNKVLITKPRPQMSSFCSPKP